MNTPTLKELADIGAEKALKKLSKTQAFTGCLVVSKKDKSLWLTDEPARQAFAQAVKDTVEKLWIRREKEAGIKRMEALTMDEIFHAYDHQKGVTSEKLNAVRSRLIAAAREGQPSSQPSQAEYYLPKIPNPLSQPAEIPWIEWKGGECPLKDEEVEEFEWKSIGNNIHAEVVRPSALRWHYDGNIAPRWPECDIIAYRVTKWREGQPAAVDWQARAEKAEARIKDLEEKNKRQADELKDISHRLGVYDDNTTTTKRAATEKCNEIHRLNAVLQKTEVELAGLTLDYVNLDAELVAAKALPQLRQLSQAGPVPEGCVRVTGYFSDTGKWAVASFASSKDTHFADIRMPATAVEAELEVVHDGGEVFLIDPYFALKAAHAAGKVIEVAEKRFGGWSPVKENHNWTFPVEEYRIKPETTFEAHGQTWTKHTPGDPMPCDGEALVFVTSDNPDVLRCASKARDWHWGTKTEAKITGWRYADKPKAEPVLAPPPQSWQPAVGDVVRLKSGGPEMVVFDPEENSEFWCSWFFEGKLYSQDFPAACLMLAETSPASFISAEEAQP